MSENRIPPKEFIQYFVDLLLDSQVKSKLIFSTLMEISLKHPITSHNIEILYIPPQDMFLKALKDDVFLNTHFRMNFSSNITFLSSKSMKD